MGEVSYRVQKATSMVHPYGPGILGSSQVLIARKDGKNLTFDQMRAILGYCKMILHPKLRELRLKQRTTPPGDPEMEERIRMAVNRQEYEEFVAKSQLMPRSDDMLGIIWEKPNEEELKAILHS